MKAIMVSPRYFPHIGGIETHVKNLVEALSKSIEVQVYTFDNKDMTEEIDGIAIHRFKPKISFGLGIETPSNQFLGALQKSEADIIHIHNLHTLLPYYICKSIQNSKIVVTPHYHGKGSTSIRNTLFSLYKTKLRYVLDKASKIICVSESERNTLLEDFTIPSDKVVIIPNGIDTGLKSLVKDTKRDPSKILFVGRFVKYKNADKIIKAMKLLDEYKLTLVGTGEEREDLVKLINELNVNDRVTLKTNISREELAKEYASSSIFILPSYAESYGISVIEALMMGLKAIVANTSALKELVSKGYVYGIDPPIDSMKIVEAVRSLESCNFKPFTDIYSWDIIAKKVLEVYEGI